MITKHHQAPAHSNRLCHGAAAIAFSLALGTTAQAAVTASPDGSTSETSPSAAESQDELAKKLANPIAAMISIPFQNNFDWGAGPNGDGFQ